MQKTCELGCGHPVGGGGDRHRSGHCPPKARPGDNRSARYSARKKIKKAGLIKTDRGAPVSVGSKGALTRGRKGKGVVDKKTEQV